MAAGKFRLQCTDYNGCEGHLTGILPLFFLFKLFSVEIENFHKTRVKFLVEIKREMRQVQKSDRINSDHQSGSDQLGSTRINPD